MSSIERYRAAIVDFGLGNLFSVKRASESAGFCASITACKNEILSSDVVILPGVGAFGDAMKALGQLDLVGPLREVVDAGKPLVGICLGLQLLMTESQEFGIHKGLGIIEGTVSRLELSDSRVPHIGWDRIYPNRKLTHEKEDPVITSSQWSHTPLDGLRDGTYMYFVHSYFAQPEIPDVVLSVSNYGGVEFCSSLKWRNVFACQFHPERSGPHGLEIYKGIISLFGSSNE